jgi:mono/diheme cytochrome c family protein
VPAQLSNLAIAGQQLYQQHACFACHGPAGSGGRAPAIGPLIARQTNVEVDQLLANPNPKMRAGGMPPVDNAQERGAIIAYLRTMHAAMQASAQPVQAAPPEIASSGGSVPYPEMAPAPATPAVANTSAGTGAASAPATAPAVNAAALAPSPGRALFLGQGCAACHGLAGQGTQFAPSLVGVANKFPGNSLPDLLHHPTAKMKAGGMPTVALTGTPLQQLVSYLASLQAGPAKAQAAATNAAVAAEAQPPTVRGSQTAQTAQTTPVPAPPLSPLARRGEQIFQSMSCASCHGVGGLHGTAAAPALAGTASLLPEGVLENLLRHHTTRMQEGGMPLTNLNAPDMRALIAYIRSMPATSNGD